MKNCETNLQVFSYCENRRCIKPMLVDVAREIDKLKVTERKIAIFVKQRVNMEII